MRNPYDRLVSLYTSKAVNTNVLHTLGGRGVAFDQGFDVFCKTVCAVHDSVADRHYRSQVKQLSDKGEFFPKELFRFEDLDAVTEMLREVLIKFNGDLPHKNKSPNRKPWPEYYTSELYELVNMHYALDFEVLGYKQVRG